MTTLQVLKKARALIRKGWCKGIYAQTKDGQETEINAPDAVKFCMSGAIRRTGGPVSHALDYIASDDAVCWAGGPLAFNDTPNRTQAQVLAAFDRAIKEASK